MWTLGTPVLELVIRAALIYLVFFAALRLFGKREIGQFTLFDLALVLLAANALQPAITGTDASILGGLIVIVTLFVINRGDQPASRPEPPGPSRARIRPDRRRT